MAQKDTLNAGKPDVVQDDGGSGGSISDLVSRTTRLQPSPTAMSLARFIDVPVSHYTGTAQLSIPLLTVQQKELQVGISLAYHSGGLKVEDQPGWTGTNWALNTGGIITRTVRGKPDEKAEGYLTRYDQIQTIAASPSTLDLNTYYEDLLNYNSGFYDSEPDVFFFSCGNYSGKFYLLPGNIAVCVPYQKLRISVYYDYGTATSEISSFRITTPEGIQYNFSDSEKNETFIANGNSPDPYNSSWYLSGITSPNGYGIAFEYYSHGLTYGKNSVTRHDLLFSPSNLIPCAPSSTESTYINTQINNAKKIKKITFSNGYVEFFPSSNREDTGSGFTDWKLDKIELHNSAGGLVKGYILNYGYFISGSAKRLKLSSVEEFGSDNRRLPGHLFTYNTQGVPSMNSLGQDEWGYYNGKDGNSVLYPAVLTDSPYNPSLLGADRSTDPSFLQGGMLTSITYPTGGNTAFEYEAHVVNIDGTAQNVGGLRIKKIIHTDPVAGNSFRKVYQYDLQETVLTFRPKFDYNQTIRQQKISSDGGGIAGDYVDCQYLVRSTSNQSVLGTGEHVIYKHVTELTADDNANGKTEYKYQYVPNNGTNNFPFPPPTDFSWWSGLLLEKKISSATGVLLQKEVNEYNSAQGNVNNAGTFRGFKTGKVLFWSSGQILTGNKNTDFAGAITIEPFYVYSRWLYLERTDNYQYDQNDPAKEFKTTRQFTYGNAGHAQLTKETSTDSKGATLETSFKYPHDFPATAPYNEMISSFIINPVIEQQQKTGTGFTHFQKTDYEKIGTKYLPKRVKIKTGTGPEITSLVFDSYDARANVTEYTENNGLKTQLNWYSVTGKADLLQSRVTGFGTTAAQTTSYTYVPLVGTQSITDPNGKTLYYEYDSFSRLINVRNTNATDGPIRASYCYNYAGQAVDCPIINPAAIQMPNQPALLVGATPLPDLSPTLDIDGFSFSPGTSYDFIINLFEVNNVTTTGIIQLRVSKIGLFNMTYPTVSGTSNVFGGIANQNSNWTFTEDANFITATSKPGVTIPAGGQTSIGFNLTRKPNTARGTQNITAVIIGGSGGEVLTTNNTVITIVSAD